MKKSWLKTAFMIALVCGLFFVGIEMVEACPNCSSAVADDDKMNGSNVGAGYTFSIMLMMGVPYLIMIGFAYGIYSLFKSSVAAQKAAHQAAQKAFQLQNKEALETA
jgi:hypothetical protein